jgi:hypothetical protein
MHPLSLALQGERFQISPGRRFADRKLLHDLSYTQAPLPRKQGKDLLLALGGGQEISHNQSKPLINNHSTFETNFKRQF